VGVTFSYSLTASRALPAALERLPSSGCCTSHLRLKITWLDIAAICTFELGIPYGKLFLHGQTWGKSCQKMESHDVRCVCCVVEVFTFL
jgi:hypothetical protein